MLAIIDILLQQLGPRHVVYLWDIVPVQLEGAEELVEPEAWVPCNLGYANRGNAGLEGASDDNTGNVVDWDHIDGVVDVRAGRQLNAALDHSDEEVVCVCCCDKKC